MLSYSELYRRGQSVQELWLLYLRFLGLPPALQPITLVGDRTRRLVTVDLRIAGSLILGAGVALQVIHESTVFS